jgi:homoserine O-acetyltransferase
LIGPDRPIDTNRAFVVCANVLGGCQGSTGPASTDPSTGRPYGPRFPMVSIRDMVRAQAVLADHLGVGRWHSVIGGSMGGMQVLEWAVMYPERVGSFVAIATTAAASAWQVAWSAVGRTALALDPRWRGGDYYDAAPGDGPHAGLVAAGTDSTHAVLESPDGHDGFLLAFDQVADHVTRFLTRIEKER